MKSFVLSLLMGAPDGGSGASGSAGFLSFAPFIAIIAIFYFLIIRPQNKKQKETQRMIDALKKGDRVVTIGGIHGIIQTVRDHSVILKVDDNVKLEFNRSAISSVEAREEKSDKAEKLEDKREDQKSGNSGSSSGEGDAEEKK
ncbi:MAG: preprotein translocase subunit YajC [Treponema sp.]|jgi:preprotein translocase subunit YajC|nr:preprotein translocase subunit YajC [Treponema sp.]